MTGLRGAVIAGCIFVTSLVAGCEKSEPPEVTIHAEPPCCPTPGDKPDSTTKAPAGFEPVEVAGVAGTGHGHAVVLASEEWALPIFVGESEGLSIELRLAGARFHRPLTHDLLDEMLEVLGGHIESVRVEREPNSVFRSVIVLGHDGKHSELDARTSDAIALALGSHVPIFVRSVMLQRDGVRIDELRHHEQGPVQAPQSEQQVRGTMTL